MIHLDTTTLIAIYGALLSTILAFWQIRKERRQLLIRFDFYPDFSSKPLHKNWMELKATNIGKRTIKIADVRLQTTSFFGWGPKLDEDREDFYPYKLDDGDTLTVYFAYTEILETIRADKDKAYGNLKFAYVEDTTGKRHFARLPSHAVEDGIVQTSIMDSAIYFLSRLF